MSTKHLRAVLETGIEAAQRHAIGPEAARIMDGARAELEAIEKAARYAAYGRIPGVPDEQKHFMDTMLAIADESAKETS